MSDSLWKQEFEDMRAMKEALATELASFTSGLRETMRMLDTAEARAAALETDRDQISLTLAVAKADRDKWFNRARVLEAAIKDVLAGRCDNWPDHLRAAIKDSVPETKADAPVCSTCGLPLGSPDTVFCSNPIHLPSKFVRTGIATPTHPGAYTSICLSCDRHMDWADKRCRLCTDCSTSDRGVAK